MPYVTLKIFAFQDRHQNKDAYDLVFTLLNAEGGSEAAGERARASQVAQHPLVVEALDLIGERFEVIDNDGPSAYAQFVAQPGDVEALAQARQQAVATVRQFLKGFRD